jgi:mono/diheme cytochrome c family protein
MKKFLRMLGWVLGSIAAVAILGYALASWVASSRYDRQWTAHDASFPIPFPLTDAEVAALRDERLAAGAPADDPLAGVDLPSVALERALQRGKRVIETRLGCNACHGADFAGRVLVAEPMVGHWVAPNLTSGKGGVTSAFAPSDWDHAVRHGLRGGGRTSTMPAIDYMNLSDRELSDIVAYIRSRPPVDNEPGTTRLGPMLRIMMALGKIELLAPTVDHMAPHAPLPPEEAVSVEFGAHLAQACRGCHGATLAGGKVPGDPGMPIVANLTPHETGLKDWTEADFIRALREGRRPDGRALSEYMPWQAYASMSDRELKAIWVYLRSLEPVEKGRR